MDATGSLAIMREFFQMITLLNAVAVLIAILIVAILIAILIVKHHK